jgi:hypothetical protein
VPLPGSGEAAPEHNNVERPEGRAEDAHPEHHRDDHLEQMPQENDALGDCAIQ